MSYVTAISSPPVDPAKLIPDRTRHVNFLARQFGKLRSFALEGLLHTAMSSLAEVTDAKTGHSLADNVQAMQQLLVKLRNGVPEQNLDASAFRAILNLGGVDAGVVEEAERLLALMEKIDADMSRGIFPSVEELDHAFGQFNTFRTRTSGFLREVERLEREWMADDVNELALRKHTEKALDELETLSGAMNMVAINASVEAARAAQNGVGFKVLALELHRLSERSKSVLQKTRKAIAAV